MRSSPTPASLNGPRTADRWCSRPRHRPASGSRLWISPRRRSGRSCSRTTTPNFRCGHPDGQWIAYYGTVAHTFQLRLSLVHPDGTALVLCPPRCCPRRCTTLASSPGLPIRTCPSSCTCSTPTAWATSRAIRTRPGATTTSHWLERAQNPDGGFAASSGSRLERGDHGLGGAGAGERRPHPLDLRRAGHSPIAYLRSQAGALRSTGDVERTILALEGAGVNPRGFGGRDLVAELRRRQSARGSFEGQVNLTAFGILALRAAGAAASTLGRSAAWLREAQNGDGGWGFQPRVGSDPDSTGAVLQALVAAGGGRGADASRSHLPAARPGRQRRLRAGCRRSHELAVNRLGHSGPGGRRGRSRRRPRSRATRHSTTSLISQAADGHYRYSSSSDQTPVWVTGPGAARGQPQGVPARGRPARAAGGRSAPREPWEQDRRELGSGRLRVEWKPGTATGPRSASGGGSGEPGRAPPAPSRVSGQLASGEPVGAPVAADAPSSDHDGAATTAYVAGGFGALVAALTGGFFWYRRRLP